MRQPWAGGRNPVGIGSGHVESPPLQFLFEDTRTAALARWKPFRSGTMRTASRHLPHREKLPPGNLRWRGGVTVYGDDGPIIG